MKQNYLVFKNKNSLKSCILLAITAGIVMLGISTVISIEHDWVKWQDNDINFRTYELGKELSTNEIKRLESNEEVLKVVEPQEYGLVAKNHFLEDGLDSNIYIQGMAKEDLEKMADVKIDNKNEKYMICSNKFKPQNASIYYNDVNYFDLQQYIGSEIELSFNGQVDKIKLIGLYDSELVYNDGDVCYTNYDIVSDLNEKYYQDDFKDKSYYLVVNKNVSSDKVQNILEENGYEISNIGVLNKDSKNKIINIVLILTIVLGLAMFFGTYMFIIKNIHRVKKDEILMQGLIAYALAIVISFTGFLIFENYFLKANVLFAKMDMTYSYIALLVGVLITFVMPLATNISMKKLRK